MAESTCNLADGRSTPQVDTKIAIFRGITGKINNANEYLLLQ